MSLRNEANAMRLRLKQMEDRSANPFSTAGSTPLVTPGIPSSREEKEQQQSDAGAEEQVKGVQHTSATVAVLETEKYSRKLLERKIKKVDKMLNSQYLLVVTNIYRNRNFEIYIYSNRPF